MHDHTRGLEVISWPLVCNEKMRSPVMGSVERPSCHAARVGAEKGRKLAPARVSTHREDVSILTYAGKSRHR